ncbi:hypothetical protein TREMEDRAFT_34129 [Tremella mesenterica DSM 1558]|uniref:uncharacterized protein n=1 Tax=Tremella mesenterica (strain ATCC 24925 / CBS 8224 / DSM 1558 / NBRC 9311 / NRRL Y-6157 / RJB 2259-6 / UBC 559-6) TaxID=578456 RepID=UPI0003F490AD|nr:uncharacterized protein TREMEDRAFT_34129 [Tremella mesenterica DSM 1558]EIW66896.1 hypothetical protein TREMEDRAFT_34129 [Tremella mesenterica DSM 1558]
MASGPQSISVSPPAPLPQRGAQTYDPYISSRSDSIPSASPGDLSSQPASESDRTSLAVRSHTQSAQPPLPSYNAVMASQPGLALVKPSQPYNNNAGHPSHVRVPSLEQPSYPPVDYGLPTSQYPPTHDPNYSSRRPISDPNELNFSQLSMSSNPPPARHNTAPAQPPSHRDQNPYRSRVGGGGYPTVADGDASASVYSLDSGLGAYAAGPSDQMAGNMYAPHGHGHAAPGWDPYGSGGYPPQEYNPYYSAASEFLNPPPTAFPQNTSGNLIPSRQESISSLARTNTSASALSSASSISLARKPTEVVGASSTRRRGGQAAIDMNKPPYTKQYVDDYRKRMKDDPDPEAQFAFSKYLIEAAKKLGDEISQTEPKLGRKYRDTLLQESLRNIKKLAEAKQPYPDAQFFLANLYGTGQLGLQVDHEKAYYLYLMASKLNHAAATYRAAVCNEIGAGTKKDYNRAVLFYRKAAALADTAAMYKLGMILLGGLLGQARNSREAIVWLRRAAAQADEDNPHALHELALLHERANNGGVVPHDPLMARELFNQAAQLGYAPAQFKLGSCHEFGTLGCPIDPRRSIAWYTKAAEKGDSEAELALSGWYLTGSEGVLKQSDTEAYLWGRKAANKGLAKAEYAVGYYSELGIGVKQDMDQAKRWYMRAAAQQHKRAMQRLTELNSAKGAKGKKAVRPTRDEAEHECIIM